MQNPIITPMEEGDLWAVLAIERQAQPKPWTEKIFREELEREWARLQVVKYKEESASGIEVRDALGFCNYWLVHDEIHLLNIAIDIAYRRKGLGALLLQHIVDVGKERKSSVITLEVRQSNEGAKALYRSHGFVDIGVRKAYYTDNREDALVMHLTDFSDVVS